MKRALDVLASVAVVVAAAAMVWWVVMIQPMNRPDPSAAQARVEDLDKAIVLPVQSRLFGNGNVAVVEFVDFECSLC